MTRYFIDTCVWRDFLEEGKYKEETSRFFNVVMENRDEIIFCEEIMYEMRKRYSMKEIEDMFLIFKMIGLLKLVRKSEKQMEQAYALVRERSLPYPDCLFAILARDNDAILVTQDKHFKLLIDIVDVKGPSEFP